jgi:hypothetical protein
VSHDKREDLLNELLQFLEEPQQERKRVSYPAPFLSIDHSILLAKKLK